MTELTPQPAVSPLANPFLFANAPVRTAVDEQGEVYFCARDVCSALEIAWAGRGNTLRSMPETWVMVSYHETIKGDRETIFVNEAGVYKLIFRSNKPLAEQFANWVCEEVLPAIRRQGFFGTVSSTERLKVSRQIAQVVGQLAGTRDAMLHQVLMAELRDLHNLIGRPMPGLELLGKDCDQLPLGV